MGKNAQMTSVFKVFQNIKEYTSSKYIFNIFTYIADLNQNKKMKDP